MSTATDGMEEIVREFLAESAEGLDRLDSGLVEMERDPQSPGRLAEIFRAVHTIKGCSGMLGYPTLESVAHAGETLLGGLRDGKLTLNPALMNGLLAMVDAMRALLNAIDLNGSEGDDDYRALTRLLEDLFSGPSAARRDPPAGPAAAHDTSDQTLGGENNASRTKIHVDAILLDQMMDLAGELILARNQVLRLIASPDHDAALPVAAQRLKRVTTDIQEAVMKARLRPIGSLWSRFPRLARDLAVSCGKQVRVEMEGSDTELDRALVEAVKDPMTHILRNAIDHGIESPAERAAAGKMPAGRLRLRAFHQEGSVHIEVADDGAGINLAYVGQRALQRGMITAEQAEGMGEEQLARLVFAPGFSTARKVTNVSGRGVGLDVVRTNIERIGGAVDLQSVAGKGTTVHLKIPLTLAILPALVVGSAGQRFAIPQANLAEVVHLGRGSERTIEMACGAPVYRLRDQLLPLCVLARALHLEGDPAVGPYIVVVRARADQFGVVVDAVDDTEEIVVKPLGPHVRQIACFAGAAVLSNGQVALVMDVAGLAHLAGVRTSSQATPRSDGLAQNGRDRTQDVPSWLLFRGTSGSRFALPLAAVARLEEIPAASIERSGGREVVQHGGEIMPVLRAARLFHEPGQDHELLQVAVLRERGQSVGLVLERIEDIVEQVVELRGRPVNDLLQGSAVIQGQIADVLSVKNVLARARASANHETTDGRG